MNPAEFDSVVDNIHIYSFTRLSLFTFKAFLTEIKDQRISNWSAQDVYGRMDPIYTYKSTNRKIIVSFDVPSYDAEEAKSNQKKMNDIKNTIYPKYMQRGTTKDYAISSPPLYRVRYANLIKSKVDQGSNIKEVKYGLLGWIDSFVFKPELESGFFEDDNGIYSKLFKFNFTLNVIHEHPVGFIGDSHQRRQQ